MWLSKNKNIRIIYDIDSGSKYISTYIQAESKVLNISYLLPDNIKDYRYRDSRFACNIDYVSQLHILRETKKKDNIWH